MKRIFLYIAIIGVAATAGIYAQGYFGCKKSSLSVFDSSVHSDVQLRENVKIRLTALLASPCNKIDVEVNNGVVNLSGTLYGNGIEHMISSAILELNGVRKVVNNLRVYALADSDIRIISQIRQALQSQPFIANPQKLNINVFDGVVVLSGAVQNVYDMETAIMIASGIEGVSAVYNNITIIGN